MSSSWIHFSGLLVEEDISYALRQLDVRVQSFVKSSKKENKMATYTLQNSKQVGCLLH